MPGAGKPAGWFQGALQSDLREVHSDEYLEFLKAWGGEGGRVGRGEALGEQAFQIPEQKADLSREIRQTPVLGHNGEE